MLSSKRRDVNHAHYGAFWASAGLIEEKFWSAEGLYPENIELSTLYVRPESQFRGVGSKLVKCGLRVAGLKSVVIGVEAQEKPRPFYEKLGFKKLDAMKIQSAGEDTGVVINFLVYDPAEPQI